MGEKAHGAWPYGASGGEQLKKGPKNRPRGPRGPRSPMGENPWVTAALGGPVEHFLNPFSHVLCIANVKGWCAKLCFPILPFFTSFKPIGHSISKGARKTGFVKKQNLLTLGAAAHCRFCSRCYPHPFCILGNPCVSIPTGTSEKFMEFQKCRQFERQKHRSSQLRGRFEWVWLFHCFVTSETTHQ